MCERKKGEDIRVSSRGHHYEPCVHRMFVGQRPSQWTKLEESIAHYERDKAKDIVYRETSVRDGEVDHSDSSLTGRVREETQQNKTRA